MTTDQIDALVKSGNIDRLKSIFELKYDVQLIETALKQYEPEGHDIQDLTKRPDKQLYRQSETEFEADAVTPKQVYDGFKPVQRISVPLQKQITFIRSAFLGSPSLQVNAEEQLEKDLIQLINKVWHDNKMPYKFNDTAKRTMSELRCAWLWYQVEDAEYWADQPITSKLRPRVKVLSKTLGDTLLPLFDVDDDMIAFARAYQTIEYNENFDAVTVEHFDVYTAEKFYFKKKVQGKWADNYTEDDQGLVKEGEITSYKKNPIKKIPIIYFAQEKPEWADVQDACNRIDQLISNHADTNDYFGNPILVGIGQTISLPQKNDAGKYVEISDDKGDLKFVTWDNAPESIKMEIENLFKIINTLTNTPDISFEQMKGIGPTSGFAIQLMFLAATLKAKDCEMSTFGEGVQRAYNYLKTLISVLDPKYKATLPLQIAPKFESVLPTDEVERLGLITSGINAGILSQESGIEQNPIVEDAKVEKDRVKDETTAAEEKEAAKLEAQAGLKAKVIQN